MTGPNLLAWAKSVPNIGFISGHQVGESVIDLARAILADEEERKRLDSEVLKYQRHMSEPQPGNMDGLGYLTPRDAGIFYGIDLSKPEPPSE